MTQSMRSNLFLFLATAVSVLALSSCSSARKERLEQRDKLSSSSGLYCDFVNGEKYNDVEVVMNLEMAKKCDVTKPFSISGYKSAAEVTGMMFCCAMQKKSESTAKATPASTGNTAAAKSGGPTLNPAPAAKPAATPSNSKDPLLDEVVAE